MLCFPIVITRRSDLTSGDSDIHIHRLWGIKLQRHLLGLWWWSLGFEELVWNSYEGAVKVSQRNCEVFHFTNFSLRLSLNLSFSLILRTFLSDSLSLSLSLSLSEIIEMKWMRVSLSLFFKANFYLWLAETLTLLIFCLVFDFLNLALSYPLVLVWY